MSEKESLIEVRRKILERAKEINIDGISAMQWLTNEELIERIRNKEEEIKQGNQNV